MWSYYGSKSKIAHLYPKPKYDRIIEPFAGTARYSLLYWDHDVTLVDKYEVIVRVWKWLQQCSPRDILSLPSLKKGDRVSREMFDCDEQLWFMQFMLNRAGGGFRWTVTEWGEDEISRRGRIAKNLYKIRNWSVVHGSYKCLGNIEATWFIDPPYQHGGEGYKESNKNIDFQSLSQWCRERQGQVIVCENTKASWLPFRPIVKINGMANTFTTEALWSNLPTDYDSEQLSILDVKDYSQ